MTKNDFISVVLENLGVLAAGQTASAEDRAVVERRMTSVFAQLAGEDVAYVADEENIDDNIAVRLADIVAMECSTPFGIRDAELAGLRVLAEDARHKIAVVTRERKHRDTLRIPNWWGGRRRGSYQGIS